MTDWMIWFVAVCVLVVLEMASATFYLLMISFGAAAGGIAAILGVGGTWQCIIAALVAAVATTLLRRSRFGKPGQIAAERNPDINLDIGRTIEVDDWREVNGAAYRARARYRGALWDIELTQGGLPSIGAFVIEEIRGNCLIVSNKKTINFDPVG